MSTSQDVPYKWWALIGLSLLAFTAFLDFTIVNTALPFIQKTFNVRIIKLQWVINIYTMLTSMFMIISGRLADLLGRRKVLYFGFVIFAIAAIGAATSQTINVLIFFRGLQGFSAAIVFTVSVALLAQVFPKEEQTRAVGIYSAFTGVGLAIGPFLGGVLIALLSWRWVFWVNIPIIIVGLVLCSFSLRESPKQNFDIKIDWLGFILLIVTIGCLIFGIIHGEQASWGALATWLNLLLGSVALIGLLIVESKVDQPLLDLSIFKNKHTALATLVCIVAGLVTYALLFFDPLFFKVIRGYSAFVIGLVLFSVPVVQVFFSLFLSKLTKKFGLFNLLIFAIFTALIAAIFHAFFTETVSIIFILAALVLMGYSWGIANAGTIMAISQSVPPEKTGVSIGTVFTFWNISGSIFLAISSVLFHYKERIVMRAHLIKLQHMLTQTQQHQISALLVDPERAKSTLLHFVGAQYQLIFSAFKSSFMSGFHAAAWFIAAVILASFLTGLLLRR